MENNVNIKNFVDKIFSIKPSFISMYGGRTPGASGAGLGSSSARDIIISLRQETAKFAELLNAPDADNSEVTTHVENIIGFLYSLQTLNQISSTFCDELLSDIAHLTGK